MDERIIFTRRAKNRFRQTARRILHQQGEKTAIEYAERLYALLHKLLHSPLMGRKVGAHANKRRCRLDKIDYIIYTVTDVGIILNDIIPYKKKGRQGQP